MQSFFTFQELTGEDECYCERCGKKQSSAQVSGLLYEQNIYNCWSSHVSCRASVLVCHYLSVFFLHAGVQTPLPPQNLMYPSKAIPT